MKGFAVELLTAGETRHVARAHEGFASLHLEDIGRAAVDGILAGVANGYCLPHHGNRIPELLLIRIGRQDGGIRMAGSLPSASGFQVQVSRGVVLTADQGKLRCPELSLNPLKECNVKNFAD